MTESRKQKLLLCAIALTTLPFFWAVSGLPASFGTDTQSLKSLAQYLSSVFGYIGISLLVWELVLGTRAISGLFFDDLSSKLKVHKFLGKYGLMLIALHPLLIMYTYATDLGYIIEPSLATAYEKYVTYGRLAFIGLGIIWISSAILRSKIAYRPWKYLHYIAYPVLIFALLHVPAIGPSYNRPLVRFYWLLFVVTTLVCLALRARHLFGYGKLSYELSSKKQVADNIWMLRMKPLQKSIDIRAGQYVYLQRSLLSEEHPFTVLDSSSKTGDLAVAIKVFGKFTQKLVSKPIGSTVLIDGPYGVFTKEIDVSPSTPVVYIAGGIGVTPFVRHILTSPRASQFMFYVNQTSQSGAFRDELKAYLGDRFVDVLSRESGADQPGIAYGRISEQIVKQYLSRPEQYGYFICGPQPMINAAKVILENIGVPKRQVHSEEFSF
ncbi:MAG TPA: ferredoxin reductase family protein [Patescibacteria group bacterium]|nr:ferredoxin reductase family protein [Patescibacteria group bacterium]